jgi:hypothetical protein
MRSFRSFTPASKLFGVLVASTLALTACGGGAPPAAAVTPSKPLAVASEPPPDVTAVPEPAGLVLVARVAKADAILKTLGAWTRLPLPGGADIVRSVADDSVADVVDLSQPIDGAIALGGSTRDPKPLIAVSVPVKSFDDAKAKLGAKHKLTPGKNGQVVVEGIGRAERGPRDDDDEDADLCVLAHAYSGARLVCGERDATEALAPYLTRTMPRQSWPSELHVEVTLGAVREPLMQVRQALPVLARSMLGTSSPALAQLVDAGVNELVDVVNDTGRMTLDAELGDEGLKATMRVDFQRAQSLVARLATSNPQRAEAPPSAFWHLPGDSDLAVFGRGSDPKLFDHPKELIGNVALEATEGAGMPEAERKAVRELVVERMLGLFTGPVVYGKGYDPAAVDRAVAARAAVKPGDLGAKDEAERVLSEQVLGWHLLQVTDPITKVGPMLRDWAQLWGRPAFTKWAKQQASSKMLATMRIAPLPAGVTLPKDTVHLEIVMPRPDLEEPPAPSGGPSARGGSAKPAKAPVAKGRKIPRKPLVLHIVAVPDQGGTWLGLGLDGKLLAQKAATALSTAPDTATLGKAAGVGVLRDAKANGAVLATIRGFLVFSALDRRGRSPYALLGHLPSKGNTPVVLTFLSQPPSEKAPGGSTVTTLSLTRAAVEDMVKIGMSR